MIKNSRKKCINEEFAIRNRLLIQSKFREKQVIFCFIRKNSGLRIHRGLTVKSRNKSGFKVNWGRNCQKKNKTNLIIILQINEYSTEKSHDEFVISWSDSGKVNSRKKNDLFSINATSSTVWPKYDGTSTQRNSYE